MEVATGRVAGPFPMLELCTSPLDMLLKKVKGEYRFIHHLFYPWNSLVNYYVDPQLYWMRYASSDTLVATVKVCGPWAMLAKCDIESAFRLLPVHLRD